VSRIAPPVAPWEGRHALLGALRAAPWEAIGRSVLGRPVACLAWGTGPTTLLVGGVHGDEPASVLCVERIAREQPPSAGRVVVVPALNPDGVALHAKDNARGVDLNRNFPTENFGTARRSGYDPGPAPASEPETSALLMLLERERPERVVAVHQPFACVNFDGPAAAWAKAIGAACGLPVRADLGYPTPGSLGTYLGVERGVPVITLELGGGDPEAEWPRALAALGAAMGKT
jgi:protein MpaA